MPWQQRFCAFGLGVGLGACSGVSVTDAGAVDAARDGVSRSDAQDGRDVSVVSSDDAGGIDASNPGCDDCLDASARDAARSDSAVPDASNRDTGVRIDASGSDASSRDASVRDTGVDVVQLPTGPLRVYMAPDGNDARSGLSAATAVRTLVRVQTIVRAARPLRDVEVRIALGSYYGQRVAWDYTMADHAVTFMPADGGSTRPIFDGCASAAGACADGAWFNVTAAAGRASNLHFRYLQVQRYTTAISFNGDRDDPDGGWNGYNEIFGCYFSRIGNGFAPSLPYSTAAVRLVNSDHNAIVNNHFVDVINASGPGLIHAIYAAHSSSDNCIANNRFQRNSGDPVRLRDFSNRNQIDDNRFIRVGTGAGYTDWYCDHDTETNCTKVAPECPSWDNSFRDNLLDGNFACRTLATFLYYQDDTTTGCARPSASSVRLRTSGNAQTTTPCSLD